MLPSGDFFFYLMVLHNYDVYLYTNWLYGATYGDVQPNGLSQAFIRFSTE